VAAMTRTIQVSLQRRAVANMKKVASLEVAYALVMAVACAISYLVTSRLLGPFIDRGDSLLGGMWAAIATAFVFRETREGSVAAGISRLIATSVSFALCSIYLALFPVNTMGIGLLIGAGTIVMQLLRRPGDIMTTAITTIVLTVVAAIDPANALEQPLLRLFDTITGIGVGVLLRWAGSCAVSAAGIVSLYK
jgi:uncharacterized membrane protein YccC